MVSLLGSGFARAGTPAGGAGDINARTSVAAFGRLPLSFEANQGQAGKDVRYLARGRGYTLHLTASGAVLDFARSGTRTATAEIRMNLRGSDAGAVIEGTDTLPGKVSYFSGRDPAKWQTGVPTYERVRYTGIYPGVNMVYYGRQRELEYDFVLAAGADAGRIQMHFSGAERLSPGSDGSVAMSAGGGSLLLHKPVMYQEWGGKRHAVAGGYRMVAGETVGFWLGKYDRRRALVIDPVLVYSTYVDVIPTAMEGVTAGPVAVDAAGNVYLAENDPYSVNGSTFIVKLNPTGTAVLYTASVLDTFTTSLALDQDGAVYAGGDGGAGPFSPDLFPTTPGAFETTAHGPGEQQSVGTVFKLDPTGSHLVYASFIAGSYSESVAAVAVDHAGNLYIGGQTASTDFPVTPGAFQTVFPVKQAYVPYSGFVTKLNPSGSALVYSTFLDGGNSSEVSAIAIDEAGDVYAAGSTESSDFPVTPGAFQTQFGRTGLIPILDRAFITKINSNGTSLVYSTFLGRNDLGYSSIAALALDKSGDTYVTGIASCNDFPTTAGAFEPQVPATGCPSGYEYVPFISKLNAAGSALVYSTYLKGNGRDNISALAVNDAGEAYLTGSTTSTDFPVTADAFQTKEPAPNGVAFLTKFNAAGSTLLYSTYLGGKDAQSADAGAGLAVGLPDQVYVAGSTNAIDFPITPGAYQSKNIALQYRGAQGSSGFVASFQFGVSTATTTRLKADMNPQFTGVPVTLTAVVATVSGAGTPDGTVSFYDGQIFLGKVSLVSMVGGSDQANLQKTFTTAGSHAIRAVYDGTTSFGGSSGSLSEAIVLPPARLTLVSGTHQTAVINTAFAQPLVVKVVDRLGQPVAGVPVAFSGAITGSTATLSALTATTGSDGTASVTARANGFAFYAGYVFIARTSFPINQVEFSFVNTKAAATLTFNHLERTYTGYPLGVFATTNPAGLIVDFAYSGQRRAPIPVGTYQVVGTISDSNYQGSATATLVIDKAAARISFGPLTYLYSGSAIAVPTTVSPSSVPVTVTYNGSTAPPTLPGSYQVVATASDANFAGSASATLVIKPSTTASR